jgi:hypothetical protein
MADKKISACTELTAPAAADVLPILDSSEASDANKNKRITLTTLFNKAHDGSVGSPTFGWSSDAGTTGIYRSAEDEVGITINSVYQGAFSATGFKLGTGTAAAQFHTFSSDTTDQIIIENSDGGVDTAPDLVLYRNSASPAANDNLGNIEFRGESSTGAAHAYAQITAGIQTVTNNNEDGILDIMSSSAGTTASRIRLYGPYVGVGKTAPAYPLHLETSLTSTALRLECIANDAASGADLTLFHRRGTAVGQDNDLLSTIYYRGHNDNSSAAEEIDYCAIEGKLIDATDGEEDGELNIKIETAGTLTTQLSIGATTSTFTNALACSSSLTVTGAIDANGGASIDNVQIGVSGDNEIDTASGNLTIDSAGGTTTIDDALTVSGAATFSENITVADAKNIVLNTTTGTKIGTATGQKLGFYNVTPVDQPAAVANLTVTASSGTLPTPDGSVTISDAASPTVSELLEYCVEVETKLEAALARLRELGLIAT